MSGVVVMGKVSVRMVVKKKKKGGGWEDGMMGWERGRRELLCWGDFLRQPASPSESPSSLLFCVTY